MFGVCENSLKWFKSYLSLRQQCVGLNGTLSKPRDINITTGVPQGYILGPLFLFYLTIILIDSKFLGINIDCYLSWSYHIDFLPENWCFKTFIKALCQLKCF